MDPAAVLFVALLLLVKEGGLPIPVPGDLLVLGAGVSAASGGAGPAAAGVLALLVAATILGGAAQFRLLTGPGRRFLLGLLARAGVDAAVVERRGATLGGARSIAVARMTPGVRVVTIPAAALAAVPARAFVLGLAVGNAVFVGAHFALGYLVGRPAVELVGRALGPAAMAALVLAAVGAAGWWLLRRRRAGGDGGGAPVLAWADACCPACLALAVAGTGRPSEA